MNFYYYILLFFLFFTSCIQRDSNLPEDRPYGEQTVFRGKLFAEKDNFLILQHYSPGRVETLDTIFVGKDGLFEAYIFQDIPDFYAIRNKNGNGIIFTASPGDSIYIQSNSPDFRYFSLSGKDEHKALEELNFATQQFLETVNKIAMIIKDSIYSNNYTEIKLEADRNYQAAYNSLRSISENIILKNEGSLMSLLALTNKLGPDFYVFHPEKDRDLFLRTDSLLYSRFPSTEAVIVFHDIVTSLKSQSRDKKTSILLPGATAPDFSLPSPEGNPVTMLSLRGKFVLLEFWASWSPACRRQNPNLLSAYNNYYDNGFEIFQISLDESREKWLAAISKDTLPWLHGADLKGWDSHIVDLYGITSIPTNFLLNPHGEIIETNLFDKDLSLKLEEIFKK